MTGRDEKGIAVDRKPIQAGQNLIGAGQKKVCSDRKGLSERSGHAARPAA
jgi:hypothetical protein